MSHKTGIPLKHRSLAAITVIAYSFLALSLYAQVSGFSNGGLETDKLLSGASQQKALQDAALKSDIISFDNVINAQKYMMGPGDVLVFQKLDAASVEEYLTVTPENTLFIPRLGMISLVGKTLEQARDTIIQLQKQRTPNIICAVALRKPRTAYVTVRGNVLFPGTVTVPASMRVSAVIKLAMQPKSSMTEEIAVLSSARAFGQPAPLSNGNTSPAISSLLPAYCMRNISLSHSDGSGMIVDLERGMAMNDIEADPYVREGDEILVPQDLPGMATISISGAVTNPATSIYKKGDKVSFLLKLGRRLAANAGEVFLLQNGEKTKLQTDENLRLLSADIALEPGAIVVVEQTIYKPVYQGSVRVIGEVAAPGVYPVESFKTRLKDVISLAGGFTTEAYLPLAYVQRYEPQQQVLTAKTEQLERLKKLQYTNLIIEDTTRFMIDQIARRPILSCDFTKAFKENVAEDNASLQDGDVIVVPRNPRTVFVYGQVRKAGYVEFVPGKTMEYYIAQAGGMTDNADKGRERVVKGRTGVWLKGEETVIEAGDQVYVPHPPDEPIGTQLSRYSSIIGLIGGVSGLVFSVISLTNLIRNQ